VASLRFVVCKEDVCWPLFGRIDLTRPGDIERGPRYRYEKILTIAEQISAAELNERLGKAMSGRPFLCDGEVLEHHLMAGQWGATRHHAYEYGSWPCVLVQVQSTPRGQGSSTFPLVSPDAPLFSGIEELRAAVAAFRQDHRAYDVRRDQILLVAWDYRGRIESLEYVAPTLSTSCGGDSVAGMTLTGRLETLNGVVSVRQPAEEHIDIRLESEPTRVALALVAGYELVDYIQEGPYSSSQATRLVIKGRRQGNPIETFVEPMLYEGENDRVEFKPWVNPATGDKRNEILETAIAFANTRGGAIIIGVDRYGQPLGEDKHLKAWKGIYLQRADRGGASESIHSGEELIRIYGMEVRDFIQNSVNRRLESELYPSVVKGCQILVLEIKRGDLKPYTTQPGNDIWIRVNATNRRPSPQELTELLTSQDSEKRD